MAIQRITPIWLRPLAAGTAVLLHATALIGLPRPHSDPPAVAAPIAVQVVPMGEIAIAQEAPQQAQVAEVTAVEAQPSDAQPAQAKAVEPPQAVEATTFIEPPINMERPQAAEAQIAETPALVTEATIRAVENPMAVLEPVKTLDQASPQPRAKPKRQMAARQRERHETEKQSNSASASSRASAVAHESHAETVTGSMASANYRSIVAAELNRRKFYPAVARSSGIQGVVVVTFTIGADGRVVRHAIARSSGQPTLDEAVHQMMAAMSLPPPPGGMFGATVPIRFDFRQ